MREIKFAGYENGHRVYGTNGEITDPTGKQFRYSLSAFFDLVSKGLIINVVEFTGLKDKNDVELYEEDTIKLPSYPNKGFDLYIIEKYGGAFHISDFKSIFEKYEEYEGDYSYHHGELVADNRFELEVVGNIYENPELLETT